MAEQFPTPNPKESSPEEITQEIRFHSIETPGAEGLPEQQPAPATYVVSSKPAAAVLEPPSPTFFQRGGHVLFSRETRFGRFMRSTVSVLAIVIILFIIWTAVAYYLLWRPLSTQLGTVQTQATQSAVELEKARGDLTKAQQDAKAAQVLAVKDRERLAMEQAHVLLLRAVSQVSAARLALANKSPSAAVKSLDEAQKTLEGVYPQLAKQDTKQVDTLKALFILTKNDLDRDPALANQDLDRLQSELDRAEKNVLTPSAP